MRLRHADGGGKVFVDPVKLEKTLDILATDIQNITDSRQGYNAEKYNEKWVDRVLFGDSEYGSTGIFSKAMYNRETTLTETGKDLKGTWTPHNVPHTFSKREKAVIRTVMEP